MYFAQSWEITAPLYQIRNLWSAYGYGISLSNFVLSKSVVALVTGSADILFMAICRVCFLHAYIAILSSLVDAHRIVWF